MTAVGLGVPPPLDAAVDTFNLSRALTQASSLKGEALGEASLARGAGFLETEGGP